MKVALTGGSYVARSIIASAQRSLNLYSESNPEDAPFPFTYYPTPGLRYLAQGRYAQVRCLHTCSNGDLFAVIGQDVWFIARSWAFTGLGTIGTQTGQCYISDNSETAVLVDGSANGWTIDLATHAFAPISDANFWGGVRVDTLDTFMVFGKPQSPQFYTSPSLAITPFDPLYFANKSTYPDHLQSIVVSHREIWLIGTLTTEIWFDAGTPDFPFARMPGAFIDQGAYSPASVQTINERVFFLSQSQNGDRIVLSGQNYQATRVSTHAVEAAMASYSTVGDAIGMVYQAEGHAYYVLTFPAADKTWCYDLTTDQWHERCWIDTDGNEHRHRANCIAYAYETVIVGDWQNGAIYALETSAFTDNGVPIKRLRCFPHMAEDGKRVVYKQFIAEMESGSESGSTEAAPPMVSLRWSDDRGATWGNPVQQSLGAAGQYNTSIQWRRLGLGRNRVFEVSWSLPTRTALNGAYADMTLCGS